VAQCCPVDVSRTVDRRWEQRKSAAIAPSDNDHEGCPVCKSAGSFAPIGSEYRGRGLIHHYWQCVACGHEWTTVVHVLSD